MQLPEGIKLVRVEVVTSQTTGEIKVFEADEVEGVVTMVPTTRNGGAFPCSPALVTKNRETGQRSEWFGFPFVVVTEETRIVRPNLQPGG
jgi:hypothetical protein